MQDLKRTTSINSSESYIENLANIETYTFCPHDGGDGVVKLQFFFEHLKGIGNWNFFAYGEYEPGNRSGYHLHQGNDELFFIIDGLADMNINGKEFPIKKNDGILIRSGTWHEILNIKETLRFVVTEINR